MRFKYRNCECNVSQDKSLGGWDAFYYSATAPDGYIIEDNFSETTEIMDVFEMLKVRIDEHLDGVDKTGLS